LKETAIIMASVHRRLEMKTTVIGAVIALSFAAAPAFAMPLPLKADTGGSVLIAQVNATGAEQAGLKRKQAMEAKKSARAAQKAEKQAALQAQKAEKKAALAAKKTEKQAALQAKKAARKAALDAKKAEKQAAFQAKKAERKAKRAAKKAEKPAST
jgi:Skp family chaperone for outer membrane proteins